MDQPTKVIIAGGGFGGIRVALDLLKKCPQAQITLITKSPTHCFQADLYEVASTSLNKEDRADFMNLAGTVAIPMPKIFKSKKLDLVEDEVTKIDLPGNQIQTKNGDQLKYDYLVLSLGSQTNYYNIPKAQDFSHPLKSTEDALNIRNDLEELVMNCQHPINIVIAGAGFTGIELACNLVKFLDGIAKKYRKDKPLLKIVEGTDCVMPGMPKWAQIEACKRLLKWDIEVWTNFKVKTIHEHLLISDQEAQVGYDYLIWTTGIKGAAVADGINGVSLNNKGQVPTTEDLSLEKFPNVFGVGDIAQITDPQTGKPVPTTAWAAVSQAKVVAENICQRMKSKPTQKYHPPKSVFVVPLGGRFAVSNYQNLQISGFFGWILKNLVSLRYFFSILPPLEALNLWRKGVTTYE